MTITTEYIKDQIEILNPAALKMYHHLLIDEKIKGTISIDHLLNLADIFKIIEKNFIKFKNLEDLQLFLPIFHQTIHLTTSNISPTCIEFFNTLYTNCGNEEWKILIWLQFFHQFLISVPEKKLEIDFNNNSFNLINLFSFSKQIRLKSLICTEILVRKFEQENLLDEIWLNRLNNQYFGEILSYLIDVFNLYRKIFNNEEFWILSLIYLHKNQKFTIYWIQKAIEIISSERTKIVVSKNHNNLPWMPENLENFKNNWSIFLIILESLEGKQSHLILPSLLMLEQLDIPILWKEFLVCELQKHTNTLVQKWSVNYVLNNFTSSDFIEYSIFLNTFIKDNPYSDALEIIIQGFNNTFLFGKNSNLNPQSFHKFINRNCNRFLEIFIGIDWKSIPIHILMKSLEYSSTNFQTITMELVFKLAAKIRRIEKKSIRLDVRKIFFNIFKNPLWKLSTNDYFKVLATIFNQNEFLSKNEKLLISNYLTEKDVVEITSISFELLKTLFNCEFDHNVNTKLFELFVYQNNELEFMLKSLSIINLESRIKLIEILNKKLKTLKEEVPEEEMEFLQMYINLHKTNEMNSKDFSNGINLVLDNFNRIGKGKLVNFSILKQIYVDRLILDINNSNLCDQVIADLDTFLDIGSINIFNAILTLITSVFKKCPKSKVKIKEETMNRIILDIKYFIRELGYEMVDKTIKLLMGYITLLSTDVFGEYINKLLDLDPTNTKLYFCVYEFLYSEKPSEVDDFYATENGVEFITKGLLFGEPLLGEQRIEFDYIVANKLKMDITPLDVRLVSLKLLEIIQFKNPNQNSVYRDYLLDQSEKLNKKNCRYFKDSKQHRMKLRIFQSLAVLTRNENEWNERFLVPILNENNQNDINFIVQLIVSQRIKNENQIIELLEKASKFSTGGLISLFIIAFLFARRSIENFDNKNFAIKIIKLILPWILGQNFKVRLQGQITIYHLIKLFNLNNNFNYLFDAITESFKHGNQIENLKKLNDYRYASEFIPDVFLKNQIIFTLVPQLTDLAIDEWFIDFSEHCYDHFQISNDCLQNFTDELASHKNEINEEILQLDNIQRKITPYLDLINDDGTNCIFHGENINEKNEIDMIVIASLVDKLPNLGGIARTCEVLGIKNLYVNSLKCTEMKEFKGLSMTAEKWLNLHELKLNDIQEFLIEKNEQGYQIIGAEQTANSLSFVDFKFPKKSILLLGHEKEGIPANLIAFVDYAVEIPQFGMVRSLNVHVTAALFLWEYCKQNLIKIIE